jgi:hypothetical protein
LSSAPERQFSVRRGPYTQGGTGLATPIGVPEIAAAGPTTSARPGPKIRSMAGDLLAIAMAIVLFAVLLALVEGLERV